MTSDERREIAATMRIISCEGVKDITLGEVLNSILTGGAPRPTTEMAILARLADLIDPTCGMDVLDTGEVADYECSEHIVHCSNCNAEFGYVLYSEDGDVSMDDKPRFCPNCGARVVGE